MVCRYISSLFPSLFLGNAEKKSFLRTDTMQQKKNGVKQMSGLPAAV